MFKKTLFPSKTYANRKRDTVKTKIAAFIVSKKAFVFYRKAY